MFRFDLWNSNTTLAINARALKISKNYAYKMAARLGLKYVHEGTAGTFGKEEPAWEAWLPSKQKFAWDGIPETYINDGED